MTGGEAKHEIASIAPIKPQPKVGPVWKWKCTCGRSGNQTTKWAAETDSKFHLEAMAP